VAYHLISSAAIFYASQSRGLIPRGLIVSKSPIRIPSFPHALSGNPGGSGTGSPIKTFGGDEIWNRSNDGHSTPRLLRGRSIERFSPSREEDRVRGAVQSPLILTFSREGIRKRGDRYYLASKPCRMKVEAVRHHCLCGTLFGNWIKREEALSPFGCFIGHRRREQHRIRKCVDHFEQLAFCQTGKN